MIPKDPTGQEFLTPQPDPNVLPVQPMQTEDIANTEIDPARAASVTKWADKVKRSKSFFSDIFEQMRRDQSFLRGKQWSEEPEKEQNYVANITQRLITQKVSALYAKDPTATCRRRKTMDFKIWDGERSSLLPLQDVLNPQPKPILNDMGMPIVDPMTNQPVMGPPAPPDPNVLALLQDVQQGLAKRFLMDRVAQTMEIVIKHQIEQQQPNFKRQMKQMVRRACTNSVGYVKIGYQRFMEMRPEDADKITDITQRLADISAKMEEVGKDEITTESPEFFQLQAELEALQATDSDHVAREGLVFDFPKSNAIIIDPACTQINGFVGAQWIAQEYHLDPDDIKKIFQKDIGDSYTPWNASSNGNQKQSNAASAGTSTPSQGKDKEKGKVTTWEIFDKVGGLVYWVADGVKDFLKEPAPPKVRMDRFWPWVPLVFNEAENEDQIYPVSDVGLVRPMQLEYNRSRNALREHRHANRPATVVADGKLDPNDERKLTTFPRNALIKLKGLQPGEEISKVLQPLTRPNIDPNLYQTSDIWDDIQRVTGSQDANLGGTSKATATESGIAESSRMSSIESNVDDLDDMLNEVFGAADEVLFSEMDYGTVQKIAGPGAAWPELTSQDIVDNLYLEIEAGSSGRPNKAVDIANAEKLIPLIMQVPGVSPEFVLRLLVQRLDDKLDPTDAVADAVQSLVAQNRNAQPAGAGANMAAGDPHMQGPQGGAPPGAMAPHPGGPPPAPGPVGTAHPSLHATLSGPVPGQSKPSAFVQPNRV